MSASKHSQRRILEAIEPFSGYSLKVEYLTDATGYSRRAVFYALKRLEEKELIRAVRRGRGQAQASTYRLTQQGVNYLNG